MKNIPNFSVRHRKGIIFLLDTVFDIQTVVQNLQCH